MLDSISTPRRPYDFEDYVDILRRNLRWIIGPTFAGLVISVVISYFMTDTYFSVALIRVTPQQISEDLVRSITSQDVADRINSLAQMILSHNTLANIINQYNLFPKERKSEPMEDVIDLMHKSLFINANAGGVPVGNKFLPAVQVGFFYPERYTAQKVCAEIVSRFINQSSQEVAQSQQEAGEFINAEWETAKHDLELAEQKVSDYQTQHAGRLPEEMQMNMQEMNTLDGRLGALSEQANRNNEQRMFLESELHIAKDRLASIHSPQAQAQNEKIAALDKDIETTKNNIAAMRERYTDDYPDLQAAKDSLAFLERQRDAAAKEKPAKADAPVDSPAIMRERLEAQAQIEQLQTQMKANAMEAEQIRREMGNVNTAIKTYQSRFEGVPAGAKEYYDLIRERDFARNRYQDLEVKREKSATSLHMEQRKEGETLELIDQASLPTTPVAPKRSRDIPIGAVIGLVVGVLLVAIREVKDTSLKNLKDARLYTQLSILGSVPLLENDVVVQRRKQVMWVGWATATIAGLAIMAGSVARYYMNK